MSKRNVLVLAVILLACHSLFSCGKTGNPRPRQASRSFVWQSVEAYPAKNCIDIHGIMSGVYSNLDEVILEIADTAPGLDCPGCPFVAGQQIIVRNLGETFDSARGELRFSYCPQTPAPTYRLRLVGINVFDTSRHAVSPEVFVEMP